MSKAKAAFVIGGFLVLFLAPVVAEAVQCSVVCTPSTPCTAPCVVGGVKPQHITCEEFGVCEDLRLSSPTDVVPLQSIFGACDAAPADIEPAVPSSSIQR